MSKVFPAFITFGVAVALATSQAFGGPPASPGVSASSAHSGVRSAGTRSHHHNLRNSGAFFSGAGGWFWGPSGPSNSQPNVNVTETITGGPSYTCTLDIPWDWPHRCPPIFSAEAPPPPLVRYERGCPAQTVTVPGADGKDQTVSVVRC